MGDRASRSDPGSVAGASAVVSARRAPRTTGDLGVRAGYGIAYGLSEPPTPKELEVMGEPFRPYRSVAAWYCWRATELTDVLPA